MKSTLRGWAERALPPPPTADPEIQRWIERGLFAQAVQLNGIIAMLSPPSAAIWVVLLWPHSEQRGLVVWFGLVLLSSVAMAASTRGWDRENGSIRKATRRLGAALASAGIVWGLIAWLWVPTDPSWGPLVGMLVVAPMAANAIFTAAVPRLFWSFQLAIVAVAAPAMATDPHPATFPTMVIVLYAVPFSGLLARIKGASDQHAAHYSATSRQMAEQLRITNADLAYEASHDTLTGLANRDTFTHRLDEALDEGRRVGVLLIDLDHFKSINDTLGHATGDAVLRSAAGRIAQGLRQDDLLARLGGDEFTALVHDVKDLAEVQRVAERVLSVFEDPLIIDGRAHQVNASIGAALHEDGSRASDLLQAADAALYDAKRLGRATYRLYDRSLRSRIAQRLTAERQLRAALGRGEIVGWFQPIVDLHTGALVSAEGLARWELTDGTVRSAGDFLQLIEDDRLFADVTRRTGVHALRVRHRLFAEGHKLNLGVNVPPASINELLTRVLREDDLSGMAVEITETGVIADAREARRRLAECRHRGAQVWLDDFGTGQSSLSLLTELPLDGVKIDRSFVEAMGVHREARTVVVAIIEMAMTLGLEVIAEGVETQEQATILRDMGATLGQGFLFSPAVPEPELIEMARTGHHWAIELGVTPPSGTVSEWPSKN